MRLGFSIRRVDTKRERTRSPLITLGLVLARVCYSQWPNWGLAHVETHSKDASRFYKWQLACGEKEKKQQQQQQQQRQCGTRTVYTRYKNCTTSIPSNERSRLPRSDGFTSTTADSRAEKRERNHHPHYSPIFHPCVYIHVHTHIRACNP